MNSIHRLYLSGPVSKGVAESQMINWAQVLSEKGVMTDFLIVYNKSNLDKLVEMSPHLKGFSVFTRKYSNYFPAREVAFFLFLNAHLKRIGNKSIKAVVQTRSAAFAAPLLLLKLFYRFKIIFEIRGAGEEGSEKRGLTYYHNTFNNSLLLLISPKVIMVSRKLLDYKIKTTPLIKFETKTEIVYGAADSNGFFYNKELRQNKRTELNLDQKIVILYIGMLNKSWQIPDTVFRFVYNLMERIENLFFLVITPNVVIGRELQNKYNISGDKILITESSQEMLNAYINASDFGLLLRDNILVNNVASPTKFAEYLLGGLPVIISEGVGDYSDFTKEMNVGIVVNTKHPDIESVVSNILEHSAFNRQTIHEKSVVLFSKQKYAELLYGILKNL